MKATTIRSDIKKTANRQSTKKGASQKSSANFAQLMVNRDLKTACVFTGRNGGPADVVRAKAATLNLKKGPVKKKAAAKKSTAKKSTAKKSTAKKGTKKAGKK